MFPGLGNMDPRRMKQMMRQLGIKSEELDAKRVTIELGDSKLVFENPQVSAVDLGGQKTYTIVGSPKEEKAEAGIPEADIEMVAEQAKVSKEIAKKALGETNRDIAEAIGKLTN